MGAGAAVVDVADDVETVDGQTLYQLTHGGDEVVGASRRYDGRDNLLEIVLLVGVGLGLVEQLLDYVAEVFGQSFVDFRAGIFRRNALADLDEAVEHNLIPLADVFLVLLDELEFLARVVDEGAEVFLLGLAQGGAEDFIDFALYRARGVFENVLEGFVFAVDVGEEVLSAFRQVEDSLEVDDFGACRGNRRKRARQQFEIFEVGFELGCRVVYVTVHV